MKLQERKRERRDTGIFSFHNWTNSKEIFMLFFFFIWWLLIGHSEFLRFSDLVPKLRRDDEAKWEVNCVKN